MNHQMNSEQYYQGTYNFSSEDGEENDAAWIDSFFLPGGILDPDEEDALVPTSMSSVATTENATSPTHLVNLEESNFSRVPSNPWSVVSRPMITNDSPPGFSPQGNPSLGQQLPGVISSREPLLLGDSSMSPSLAPPPGLAVASPSLLDSNPHNLEDSVIYDFHSPQNFSSQVGGGQGFDALQAVDQASTSDEYMLPLHLESSLSDPEEEDTTPTNVLLMQQVDDLNEPNSPSQEVREFPQTEEDKDFDGEPPLNDEGVGAAESQSENASQNSHPSLALKDEVSEIHESESHSQSISPGEVDGSHENSHDEIDEQLPENDEDDENDETDCVLDNSGYSERPMHMLTLDNTATRLSATSSLSTSSHEGSKRPESSSESSDDDSDDDSSSGLDKAADALRENKARIHIGINDRAKSTQGASGKDTAVDSTIQSHLPTMNWSSVLVQQLSDRVGQLSDQVFRRIGPTAKELHESSLKPVYSYFHLSMERWSKRRGKVASVASDFLGVVAILASKMIGSVYFHLAFAFRIFWIVTVLLIQIGTFAVFEVAEERHVAACYAVFYCVPAISDWLMQLFILPHWTPPLLATIGVWMLCEQAKPGKLSSSPLTFRQLFLLAREGNIRKETPVNGSMRHEEKICKTILLLLRRSLPVLFFLDGFARPLDTIMGAKGVCRLSAAFMMSLIRQSIVSSPLGWASWALQVLIATYNTQSFLVEIIVLIVGLSSIRLTRFLEEEGPTTKYGKRGAKY